MATRRSAMVLGVAVLPARADPGQLVVRQFPAHRRVRPELDADRPVDGRVAVACYPDPNPTLTRT
ncbi:hypothetical protein ACIBG5_13590 [Kribbella sp. NPDC050241]|uniref:hypothetical protein n=1 Tax=Kribbella sp. NPDC050241 TaxID=3364115 RepID=UPI0037A7079A